MWNVTDDLTNEQFDKTHRIGVEISFTNPADKKFYKAKIDISPRTYMEKFGTIIPAKFWMEYFKHTTDAEKAKFDGKEGHYEPAKNVKAIIASLVEETPEIASQ